MEFIPKVCSEARTFSSMEFVLFFKWKCDNNNTGSFMTIVVRVLAGLFLVSHFLDPNCACEYLEYYWILSSVAQQKLYRKFLKIIIITKLKQTVCHKECTLLPTVSHKECTLLPAVCQKECTLLPTVCHKECTLLPKAWIRHKSQFYYSCKCWISMYILRLHECQNTLNFFTCSVLCALILA